MNIPEELIHKCAEALYYAMARRFGFTLAHWPEAQQEEWQQYVRDIITEAAPIIDAQARKAERKGLLLKLSEDAGALEIGRKAIEDVLVEWRDNGLSEFNRGNGLVIRSLDGRDSDIIRFGPEGALRIGLRAIAKWSAL